MDDELKLPDYMEPDSEGPLVNALIRFLNQWKQQYASLAYLQPATENGRLGGRATLLLMAFQKRQCISVDGGCGPETRRVLSKTFNFDLAKYAASTDTEDGITTFVQPNGAILYWARHIGIQEDRRTIEMMFRRSRHGN